MRTFPDLRMGKFVWEVRRAHQLLDEGKFAEAKELLGEQRARAEQLRVRSSFLDWMLCVVNDNLGEVELAWRNICDALKEDPLNAQYQRSFDVVAQRLREQLGDLTRPSADPLTERLYRLLLAAGEADLACHLAMARHLATVGRAAEAMRLLDAVTLLAPVSKDAWLAKAALAQVMGNDALAAECDAQAVDRKWTRDKQALAAAGVPIRFVEGVQAAETGYLVEPKSYYLEKLNLEPVEAALLGAAAAAALRIGENPAAEALESAVRKLAAAIRPGMGGLPQAEESGPRAVSEGTGGAPRSRRQLAALLEQLREAVHARRRVRIRYLNNALEESEREVDVYGYAWRRGVWLFAGWCHRRQAVRVFYATRVRSLRWANPKSEGGEYRIPRDFDIRDASRQQPWEYRAHEPLEATLALRGSLAGLARSLFPKAEGYARGEGLVTVSLRVTDLGALVRHALFLGPECELVAPEEGREQARRILEGLRKQLAEAGEVAA